MHSLNKYLQRVSQVPGAPDVEAAAGRVCSMVRARRALTGPNRTSMWIKGRRETPGAPAAGRWRPGLAWGEVGQPRQQGVFIGLQVFQHVASCHSPSDIWQLKKKKKKPSHVSHMEFASL